MNNGEALVNMLRDNLEDWLLYSCDSEDIALLFCRPGCLIPDRKFDCDDDCRACIRQWLHAPHSGDFNMAAGRFVMVRK